MSEITNLKGFIPKKNLKQKTHKERLDFVMEASEENAKYEMVGEQLCV
jgi:hypothetical protein